MKKLFFAFLQLSLAWSVYGQSEVDVPKISGRAPRFHALLISAQNYKNGGFSLLVRPNQDAKELRDILVSDYSFESKNVKLVPDKSKDVIMSELYSTLENLTEDDNVIVFFSGHGTYKTGFNKNEIEGFLVPVTGEKKKYYTFISLSDITTAINSCRARHILLITDACYSGSLVKRIELPDADYSINAVYQRKSRQLMTSGNLEPVPDNSVFIYYLIKNLKENKDKYVTVENLFGRFLNATINNTYGKTIPICSPLYNVGDEGGQFVFIKSNASVISYFEEPQQTYKPNEQEKPKEEIVYNTPSKASKATLDKAKRYFSAGQHLMARDEIEQFLGNSSNYTNSDGWYQKMKIYNAIANDIVLGKKYPDARNTAFEAARQYLNLEKGKEAGKRNVQLALDGNAPLIEMYTGYSKDAANYYNSSNFNDALINFKRSLDVFDIMAVNGIIPIKLDTTTTLYAGISAEKAQKPDEAAIYYSKIAEAKAKGEGFVEIYKWLTDYYHRKNDLTRAAKFSRLGREVYPGDPYWNGIDLDMARGKSSKDDLWQKYEQAIRENPDNYLFLFNYGVELYQAGYDPDQTKRPANSEELIEKAIDAMSKVLQKNPNYANANMVLGQIYYNQGVEINNKNKKIRSTNGVKLTPEQLREKELLREATAKKFDQALPYLIKVEELLGSQSKLKLEDKDNLKNALDLLIIINEEKVNQLEQKKRLAQARGYTTTVQSFDVDIKDTQAKITVYTEKFNNIDKTH